MGTGDLFVYQAEGNHIVGHIASLGHQSSNEKGTGIDTIITRYNLFFHRIYITDKKPPSYLLR